MNFTKALGRQVGKALATKRTCLYCRQLFCQLFCTTFFPPGSSLFLCFSLLANSYLKCQWLSNSIKCINVNSSHYFTSFVTNCTRWWLKTRQQLHSSSSMKFKTLSSPFLCFVFADEEYNLVSGRKLQLFLHVTTVEPRFYDQHSVS